VATRRKRANTTARKRAVMRQNRRNEKREGGGERRDKTNGNPRAAAALAAQGCEQKGGGRKAHLGHGCHRCGGGLDLAAQHLQGLVRGRGVGARLLQPLDGELQRLLQDLILGRERGTVLLVLLILLGAGVHLLGVRRRHLDGNSVFLLLVGHAPGESSFESTERVRADEESSPRCA
jgi:hypothetical protein